MIRVGPIALLVTLALLPGCELLVEGQSPSPVYWACATNQVYANCVRGSTCEHVSIRIDPRQPEATFCSHTCTTASDCPTMTTRFDGGTAFLTVACVTSSSGSGVCHPTCTTDADCIWGRCVADPATSTLVCVPDNSSFKAFGERCASGVDVCGQGTSCMTANVSSDTTRSTTQTFCSASCTTESDCQFAGPTRWGSACIALRGASQCYERCDDNVRCPEGMSCVGLLEANGGICVPPP